MADRQVRTMVSATGPRIARAASALFRERGYVKTTMADIAAEADVVVQTIYNVVGSKADVLSLVLDETVAGSEAPRAVPEFMRERTEGLESPEAVIGVLGEWFAEMHPRSADVFRMIAEAAVVDPDVAELQARREAQRLANYREAARVLADRGAATPGVEETAAAIWSLGHPLTYRRLVIDEGWTLDMYRTWVEGALERLVLGPRAAP